MDSCCVDRHNASPQVADVERIARLRGGGGHRNAAGCEVHGTIDAVREEIVADLLGALGPQE